MKGWVYIISNKSMPGLLKIGYSMKDPEIRAIELDGTGIPHKYVVDYEVLVEDPYSIEQAVHKKLKKYWEAKEWFNCNIEKAIATIKSVIGENIYVENYFNADETKANNVYENEERLEQDLKIAKSGLDEFESNIAGLKSYIESVYKDALNDHLPGILLGFFMYIVFPAICIPVILSMLSKFSLNSDLLIASSIGAVFIGILIKQTYESSEKNKNKSSLDLKLKPLDSIQLLIKKARSGDRYAQKHLSSIISVSNKNPLSYEKKADKYISRTLDYCSAEKLNSKFREFQSEAVSKALSRLSNENNSLKDIF